MKKNLFIGLALLASALITQADKWPNFLDNPIFKAHLEMQERLRPKPPQFVEKSWLFTRNPVDRAGLLAAQADIAKLKAAGITLTFWEVKIDYFAQLITTYPWLTDDILVSFQYYWTGRRYPFRAFAALEPPKPQYITRYITIDPADPTLEAQLKQAKRAIDNLDIPHTYSEMALVSFWASYHYNLRPWSQPMDQKYIGATLPYRVKIPQKRRGILRPPPRPAPLKVKRSMTGL